MNPRLRRVAETFLSGVSGHEVSEFEYEILKRFIPEFFCNVTLFQITNCNELNAVLHNIDADWVRYIPNQLKTSNLFKLCNTGVTHEALVHVNTLFVKEDLLPFIRCYNENKYTYLPKPKEWPDEWRQFSVASYTAIQLGAVVRLIIGGHQHSPRMKLMRKLLLVMRSFVSSNIACYYCHCDHGQLYKNPRCNHIPYFHRECLAQQLDSVSFDLRCPGENCARQVDIFGSSALMLMPSELVSVLCCVCHQIIELNEIYCREFGCGHTYHQRCMQYSSAQRCVNRLCNVRLSMAFCNWATLVDPRN